MFLHKRPETIEVDELRMCLDLAIESRQRILDQLAISHPGEFNNFYDLSHEEGSYRRLKEISQIETT